MDRKYFEYNVMLEEMYEVGLEKCKDILSEYKIIHHFISGVEYDINFVLDDVFLKRARHVNQSDHDISYTRFVLGIFQEGNEFIEEYIVPLGISSTGIVLNSIRRAYFSWMKRKQELLASSYSRNKHDPLISHRHDVIVENEYQRLEKKLQILKELE